MRGRNRSVLRSLLVAAAVFGAVLVPGEAWAVACFGPPVTSNTTLMADITDCADNGIEIGASGITIDLNGFTIDGDDDADDFGIYNPGFDNVRIVGPGTIQEFGTGIRIEDASANSVTNVEVTGNNATSSGIAVTPTDVDGAGADTVLQDTVVRGNNIHDNAGSGVIVYRGSNKTKIVDNTITANGGDGIFLGGAGESTDLDGNVINNRDDLSTKVSKALISGNAVDANAGTGIAIVATGARVDFSDEPGGSGNVISNNSASGNGTNIEVENSTAREGVGHEERGHVFCCDDKGGHGIKVAGVLSETQIINNDASGNGMPAAADDCFERNGAGIFIAGQQQGISITGNTTDGNAMAGVFAAGNLSKLGIKDGPSTDGNNGNCEDDEAGIMVTGRTDKVRIVRNAAVSNGGGSGIEINGHKKNVVIKKNVIENNVADGGGGSVDTAGILVSGRSLNLSILNNVASGNDNTSGVLAHGIDVRGSVRKVGKKANYALLVKGNTTNDNEGHGVGVFVEHSKPIDNSDPQDNSGNQSDSTQNKLNKIKVAKNQANNNGTDGIFTIADVKIKNNTADNNTDFGIEHNSDPTVSPRFADAADGPHRLKDGGGNSASGNGTNCSAGLSC